ncbi:hypothetical protein [Nocardiopsis sp. MG754419]|uniref:hypothetical protein n=1 Tax=Nocardiopsis sp. MG754419 TaxID=2259865 RepID=UPI001BA8A451|nr:hypothetical protein [Nocardiopsis sp. MG754419]MBR8741010.1 hypothetical protein [Nocardiopsis sp. MG754419]
MSERTSPGYRLRGRLTLHAHRHPRRHGALLGVAAGLLFGLIMGAFSLVMHDAFPAQAVITGVASGLFFGLFMGFFFGRMLRDAADVHGYPIGTDQRHAADAQAVLAEGRPGSDPLTNEVAARQARTILGTPYHPKTMVVVLSLLTLLTVGWAVAEYGRSGLGFPFVLYVLLGLGLLAVLTVLFPLDRRRRRRAAALLDALED